MKKYLVKVKFNSPYMQHRMDDVKLDEWEKLRGPIGSRSGVSNEDLARAEYASYYDKDAGSYYIPSNQFKGAFVEAGKLVKGKIGGASRSMKNVVAGMFIVGPEHIKIPAYDEIDKRSAVNRVVKARVITIRPRWKAGLEVEFELLVKSDNVDKSAIESIIKYSGSTIGVGSYRPTSSGEFGCYDLVSLIEIKD